MRPDLLDYAAPPEVVPGLGRLGRFCLGLMGAFLVLDAVLMFGGRLLPAAVYQLLCFVSLGGLVAGAMGIGVAAMAVQDARWKAAVAVVAILCVLATMIGSVWFTM